MMRMFWEELNCIHVLRYVQLFILILISIDQIKFLFDFVRQRSDWIGFANLMKRLYLKHFALCKNEDERVFRKNCRRSCKWATIFSIPYGYRGRLVVRIFLSILSLFYFCFSIYQRKSTSKMQMRLNQPFRIKINSIYIMVTFESSSSTAHIW